MLQGEHSAIHLTFIKLPFAIKIFVLSIFEWPFYTGFTVLFKAAYSVTMNIFRKFLFSYKSFVKVELSYVFTIKMFSTAENCVEN